MISRKRSAIMESLLKLLDERPLNKISVRDIVEDCGINRNMNILCIILGIEIIADGLFKVQTSLDARRFGLNTWWLILSLAIIAGAIGAVLIFYPSESVRALTWVLGLSLLVEGVLNLCVALCAIKIIEHQRPDTIEAEIY